MPKLRVNQKISVKSAAATARAGPRRVAFGRLRLALVRSIGLLCTAASAVIFASLVPGFARPVRHLRSPDPMGQPDMRPDGPLETKGTS